MNREQEQTTDTIQDPALRQLAAEFRQRSLAIAAYHLLHIREAMLNQALAAIQPQIVPPLSEPDIGHQAGAKRFLDGCKQAGAWVVREVLTQLAQRVPERSLATENQVIVIDASTPIVRDKQAASTKKTEVQDGTTDTVQ